MRILIISDIHSNLTALEAVLAHASPIEAVWCLGDLVGYGPDPNECIQRIQELPNLVCLHGNHDAAAAGMIEVDTFNYEARTAVEWTQSVLSPANVQYLRSLPDHTVVDSVSLAHGSPREPTWEYLLDIHTATVNFDHFETPFCFVGHSHVPVVFQLQDGAHSARLSTPAADSSLEMTPRAIFNPGSVGQPRDHDPRAAYAIFDQDNQTWYQHRVEYDIPIVQARMYQANLPPRHIQRLSAGW